MISMHKETVGTPFLSSNYKCSILFAVYKSTQKGLSSFEATTLVAQRKRLKSPRSTV